VKTYSPEEWIPEIPFDAADWGDKQLAYPDGLFDSEADFQEAIRKPSALPTKPPLPGVEPDEGDPYFDGSEWVLPTPPV
jgi:hypothetical protein